MSYVRSLSVYLLYVSCSIHFSSSLEGTGEVRNGRGTVVESHESVKVSRGLGKLILKNTSKAMYP